jgi:hypothetical protein
MIARTPRWRRLLVRVALAALLASVAFLCGKIAGIASATAAIERQCLEYQVFIDGPYEYGCDFHGAH